MPSVDPKDLSVSALKSNLLDIVADHKDDMGPYLYWLRTKLKAQGARNDLKGDKQGFGPWVEANLPISRKTADTWANDWAIENDLMTKPTSRKSSKGSGGPGGEPGDITDGKVWVYYNMTLEITEPEQEVLILAWETLGDDIATRLVYDTLRDAARTALPKTDPFKTDMGELVDVSKPKPPQPSNGEMNRMAEIE